MRLPREHTVYVAACGQPCSSSYTGRQHERACWDCQSILNRDEDEEYDRDDADDNRNLEG